MNADRWEHGSDFHRVAVAPDAAQADLPWSRGRLCGSGRDALRLLVEHGVRCRAWTRLWIPAYFCQEVAAVLRVGSLRLVAYPDLPDQAAVMPPADPGDAVLLVNTFGLRDGPSPVLPDGVDLIEDHTHDPVSPWARTSQAHFAIASLRKTVPVPEGGVLWSPAGVALPDVPPLSGTRAAAAESKRLAMALKARYLDGEAVDKTSYRALALGGEAEIATGPVSGMTSETAADVMSFPWERWRERRRENAMFLSARLRHLPGLRVLQPRAVACVPFAVVLATDDEDRRARLRARLIDHRVYPAVLWPLDEAVVPVPEDAVRLSRRVLGLHCDFRYDVGDLATVADRVEDTIRS